MFDLTGKTALVTGATGGIGGAIARALHGRARPLRFPARGARCSTRSPANWRSASMSCPAISPTRTQVEKLVPQAEEAMEQARYPGRQCRHHQGQSVRAIARRGLGQVIDVNLTATFRLARAAMKAMMRRRFGRIIGITSVVGVTGNPGQGNYTAAKAGMIGMMKSIAKEYARRGVTANCVAPGFIATAMTDKLNDKQREAILARVPAGRLGSAGRCRRGGGLSCLRRGLLCHRPDPACERRHGDDLSADDAADFALRSQAACMLAKGFEVW